MTVGPTRTVSTAITRLDSSFSEFAAAFNKGQYVLWLGSGISRDRVPNVTQLLQRVLEHLRSNVDASNPACVYRTALIETLRIGGLDRDELEGIDFTRDVESWPLRDRITASLVMNYSRVLDVGTGDNNPDDYLVWTGLDVPNTYGSPDLEPDVEHYSIGILMMEGLVESAVTANWDGLLEKALEELTPSFDSLVRVAVRPDDFRVSGTRIDIIKFHGCAVRARTDEASYRRLLIARESQISGWTAQPENKSMSKHLELLYTNRAALMIGLSVQDANLHTMFAQANQDLAHPWPASPPAVVLSEEELESYHRHLLKLTYGSGYQGHADAIGKSALLGSYGKPTLLALLISSLAEKLSALVEFATEDAWDPNSLSRMRIDLIGLRNLVASQADPANWDNLEGHVIADFQRRFLARLIDGVSLALTIFRTGQTSNLSEGRYSPLSERPIAQAVLNPDFPSAQFGRLAVVLSLIGRGVTAEQWRVNAGESKLPRGGVARMATAEKETRVFFVKDALTSTILELDDSFDATDEDVLIVVADEEPRTMTRSPRPRYGRNGVPGAGRFNVASSIASTGSMDELYESFKLAGGF